MKTVVDLKNIGSIDAEAYLRMDQGLQKILFLDEPPSWVKAKAQEKEVRVDKQKIIVDEEGKDFLYTVGYQDSEFNFQLGKGLYRLSPTGELLLEQP